MKFNSVMALARLLALLLIMPSGPTAFADDSADLDGPLTCRIEYWSVGHLGERNDAGWLLAWKATVSSGTIGRRRSPRSSSGASPAK